jgi:hypothetical protein
MIGLPGTNKSSRGILDAWVLEVALHTLGVGCDERHVLAGGCLEASLGTHGYLQADGRLQVGIEPLVRAQLGAVAGQVEHLDGARVLGQPRLDRFAGVSTEIVQDQDNLLARSLAVGDQGLSEGDELFVVESPLDDQLAGLTSVRDGGDHRQLLAPAARGHGHWGLALEGVAAATHVGVDQCGLIPPGDLRLLGLGTPLNSRVLLLKPALASGRCSQIRRRTDASSSSLSRRP